jgi:hypothetical protein
MIYIVISLPYSERKRIIYIEYKYDHIIPVQAFKNLLKKQRKFTKKNCAKHIPYIYNCVVEFEAFQHVEFPFTIRTPPHNLFSFPFSSIILRPTHLHHELQII